MLKAFFKWLFDDTGRYHISFESEYKKQKTKGDVVTCHDCNRIGYCVPIDFDAYMVPPGWQYYHVGLSRLYLCEHCIEKRRELGRRMVEVNNRRHLED